MNDGFVAAMLFIGGLVIGVAIMMIVWSTNVEGAIKTRFFTNQCKLYHITEVSIIR